MHYFDSWIKIDQLDVTCFIISLFNAQHVSDINTSILRSLRLICWVISWVVLIWFDVVWLGWCGIRMQAEALVPQPASETCWALNNEIIKQVTSSWSTFIQLPVDHFCRELYHCKTAAWLRLSDWRRYMLKLFRHALRMQSSRSTWLHVCNHVPNRTNNFKFTYWLDMSPMTLEMRHDQRVTHRWMP